MFRRKSLLDILIQKAFELALIPTRIGLFSFHNERGIGSDPITEGFVDSKGRWGLNQLNGETMFIEPIQFSNPVRELCKFLFQIRRILVHLFLMEFLVKPSSIEEDPAATTLTKGGHHMGDNFQKNGFHGLSPYGTF
jgi:hypothetical protein